MINRTYWLKLIETLWEHKNVIWLAGVRRAGKTSLCRSLEGAGYFDCELPSVRNAIEEPESFLKNFKGSRLVLDEVHRLKNPSELLKIAADYFPGIKVIATGSSMLSAARKFKDTLTGRKADIWLTPLNSADMRDFAAPSVEDRLLKGGLPPYFMAAASSERDYYDWMENYWARDVQDLFSVGKRGAFLKFAELLLVRSGGIFEASSYAAPCEVSRGTIQSYLDVLEATFIAHIIRPFSRRGAAEIISAPKIYAFDTGFIRAFKGIAELRPEDKGFLWEHLTLNEIFSVLQSRRVNYWRDKQGHEVDFVLAPPGRRGLAIECKWREAEFSPKNLKIFARHYPDFGLAVAASDVAMPHEKSLAGLNIKFVNLKDIKDLLFEFDMPGPQDNLPEKT